MYSAILLAGGKGTRTNKPTPKQYLLLAGKPMLMHSVERLDLLEDIGEIIIVCEPDYVASIQNMAQQYAISTPVLFAEAGASRQQSVYNGLKLASHPNVVIHEAARPFVTCDDFRRLLDTEEENAMLGYPIPFTVLEGGDYVTGTLDRSKLVNVQLPQKFAASVLLAAHEKAAAEGAAFTEDASMVYHYLGTDIKIVPGSGYNVKITEPVDLLLGEVIYREYIVGRK